NDFRPGDDARPVRIDLNEHEVALFVREGRLKRAAGWRVPQTLGNLAGPWPLLDIQAGRRRDQLPRKWRNPASIAMRSQLRLDDSGDVSSLQEAQVALSLHNGVPCRHDLLHRKQNLAAVVRH